MIIKKPTENHRHVLKPQIKMTSEVSLKLATVKKPLISISNKRIQMML